MITPVRMNAPITTPKQRQREVEQRLSLFGLRGGPFGLTSTTLSSEEDRIRRLRAALETLGPVFCGFGHYLSTRVDLLGTKNCQELASLSDRGEASSPAAIQRLINQELGCPPDDAYVAFEEWPFKSSLFHQQHRARLRNGQAVIVKVLKPEAEESLHYDVELLQLLKGALLGKVLTGSQIDSTIADFRVSLLRQTDFSAQAGAFATVSKDTEVFLRTPLVYDQSSTARVLTIEHLPGTGLEDLLKSSPEINEDEKSAQAEERYTLARRLCAAWLRQALLGSLFPSEPFPENITILPNNQIAFNDGCFFGLTSEVKANLWNYLVAVITENPDVACSCLLKELDRDKHTRSETALRQAFRQIVPFRESELSYSFENNSVADFLFLHWRLAAENNYWPRPHLTPFYRGLFVISDIAQRFAPTRDALKDSLQDVRVMADVDRFREMLSMREFGEQMDKYFGMMIDLPQKVDQALTLIAEGNARLRLRVPESSEPMRKKRPLIMVALMIATAIVILMSHYLKDYFSDSWAQSVKAMVFLSLAVMLLRNGSRS